jgi:hypothetical protein
MKHPAAMMGMLAALAIGGPTHDGYRDRGPAPKRTGDRDLRKKRKAQRTARAKQRRRQ